MANLERNAMGKSEKNKQSVSPFFAGLGWLVFTKTENTTSDTNIIRIALQYPR